jgi:LAS superfamily LD-carboxypeptidase LdcB
VIADTEWLGLSQDHLVSVDDTHLIHTEGAHAFKTMQQAAMQDGIDLQIVSSYRSFARQLRIWNQKWSGQRPLYSRDEKHIKAEGLSPRDKLDAILTFSALPGTSRHHWGTDIDVWDKQAVESSGRAYQMLTSEYCKGGSCFALSQWLKQHAKDHGFIFPYSSYVGGVAEEPWHISYAPVAQHYEHDFSISTLYQHLNQTEIQGKADILKNLDYIIGRYVLNKGESQ